MLTQVDKLDFLVLVDNCELRHAFTQISRLKADVEWISTLPPGFVYELPQHLTRPAPNGPPLDPMTGLPVLDLDNYCCGAHGLSILIVRVRTVQVRSLFRHRHAHVQTTEIEGRRYHILMDGGPESKSIERNVNAMKVPLNALDAIVLSHWHRDRERAA